MSDSHQVLEITPKQAYEMHRKDQALLIDVRSSMEYYYVGYIPSSILIPWAEPPLWEPNADFLSTLKKITNLKENQKKALLFLCRSGHRSYQAAALAALNDIGPVYDIQNGFEGDLNVHKKRSCLNGWCFDGLPWVQS